MSLNGSGVAQINTGGQPVVNGTAIDPTVFNNLTADLATMISTCVMKDGQQTVTANIPLGGFKLTGMSAGTSRTDSASLATIQDGTGVYVATVAGTVDVITLTPSPGIAAYVAGQRFYFIAAGANTTNVTVAINGLAAKAITKNGTTALVANDILASQMVTITYDGTRFILGTHLTADQVTLTGTQTLTNKSVVDGTFTIVGSVDATKKASFEVDGLTTATTRTYTLQDSSDTMVGRATTDTLTNKTPAGLLVPAGTLFGLTLSDGTSTVNDVAVAIGECASDDTTTANRTLIPLTSALNKKLDVAWVVGTNQGLRASGAAIANTTYHLFLIQRPDTGVVDMAADTSVTGANLAANTNAAYTKKRRIGSIIRAAGTIIQFIQDGDTFQLSVPLTDITVANPGTAAVGAALTVPSGLRVEWIGLGVLFNNNSGDTAALVTDLSTTDTAPTTNLAQMRVNNIAGNQNQGTSLRVYANTSASVRYRLSASNVSTNIALSTIGWVDRRGRDA